MLLELTSCIQTDTIMVRPLSRQNPIVKRKRDSRILQLPVLPEIHEHCDVLQKTRHIVIQVPSMEYLSVRVLGDYRSAAKTEDTENKLLMEQNSESCSLSSVESGNVIEDVQTDDFTKREARLSGDSWKQ